MFEPVVKGDDVKDVQVLALVFMETFHLDIKKGIGIHGRPCALLDQRGEILFVFPLDPAPLFLKTQIIGKALDAFQFLQVFHPPLADLAADQPAQLRVADNHETPGSHAVGHVAELLRLEFIKIAQDGLLEQFANAVLQPR